jgi:hypothetical protein
MKLGCTETIGVAAMDRRRRGSMQGREVIIGVGVGGESV